MNYQMWSDTQTSICIKKTAVKIYPTKTACGPVRVLSVYRIFIWSYALNVVIPIVFDYRRYFLILDISHKFLRFSLSSLPPV